MAAAAAAPVPVAQANPVPGSAAPLLGEHLQVLMTGAALVAHPALRRPRAASVPELRAVVGAIAVATERAEVPCVRVAV